MVLNRAQRYLFRQVFVSMLFIVGTLTAVIWLTQSMRFVKYILNQGLSIETFFHLTALLLPSFLLLTMPIAVFLGTLFTLNKLTNDRELLVMRSTGMSDMGLAAPIMTVGLIVTLIGYFLSLFLMPLSFREFRELQYSVRNNFSAGLIQEGTFNSFGEGLTIYVRTREGDEMRGILVQDTRKPETPVTMMAERGLLSPGDDGPRVIMFNGNRQELEASTGQVSVLYFDRYSFDIAWMASAPKDTWRQPSERFLGELLYPDMNDAGDRYYASGLRAEGHNRLSAPLYGLGLAILAAVFMLYGEFNKRGQIKRLVIAFAAVGAMQGIAIGVFNMAGKQNLLIPLMYANAILPILVGTYFLARNPRFGSRRTRPRALPRGAEMNHTPVPTAGA